jgi:hypothetical protein
LLANKDVFIKLFHCLTLSFHSLILERTIFPHPFSPNDAAIVSILRRAFMQNLAFVAP